jgi:hypothetical protein
VSPGGPESNHGKREIYIEFVAQGGVVKATAIDSVTGTEVCIFGAASTPRDVLEKNAVAKLEYILKKKAGG